jgi:methylenetetrahydrofolate reductase (NADPH)
MDRSHIDTALANCHSHGLPNILALRGDPPVGQERWTASDSTLTCARDLLNYIKEKYGDYFNITVAGYPEGHPAAMTEMSIDDISSLSPTELQRYCRITKTEEVDGVQTEVPVIYVCKDDAFQTELDYLKSKVDAGASAIITQMFFDVDVFVHFVTACRNHGIQVPIIPGIMCLTNYPGFMRMIKMCKTRVTDEIMKKMEELKEDAEAIKHYGVELGVSMCKKLAEAGVPGFHLYTLNNATVTSAILEGLGYHRVNTAEVETVSA